MKPLEPPDSQHLEAADGWLELGNHVEAQKELECIAPHLRSHPDVLELRWRVYAGAKQWEKCLDIAATITELAPERSDGWAQRSYALHQLKRTQEALDNLMPVAEKFSDVWTIPYCLAGYCAQLGRLDECEKWFKKALDLDKKQVLQIAFTDADLFPFWETMRGPS